DRKPLSPAAFGAGGEILFGGASLYVLDSSLRLLTQFTPSAIASGGGLGVPVPLGTGSIAFATATLPDGGLPSALLGLSYDTAGNGAQLVRIDFDTPVTTQTQAALGQTPQSGWPNVYVGARANLFGFDTSPTAQAPLLFSVPLSADAVPDPTLTPSTHVWNDGLADHIHLLVPTVGLGLFDPTGTPAQGWPAPIVPNGTSALFQVMPDGTAIAADGSDTLRAFDPQGTELWSWSASAPGYDDETLIGLTLGAGSTLYVTTSRAVYALDAPAAGPVTQLWSWSSQWNALVTGAALSATQVFVLTEDGRLHAIPR
ncbi:MAG: hypothetical protein JST92_05875, partial [Deltaproteobacteria bacterium]|nr:hypothetical protein [Deltaproteobacteria bacterium]